jgi:hypothetical protein
MEQHLSSKKYKTHTKTEQLTTKFPKCLNHPTKPSEIFCFGDNCCLCSTCALLKHKDHHILEINEATQKLQKEMESFFTNENIKIIEESIEKVNVEISERNEKYEKDLKKLKEDYIQDLNVFEDSKLKWKENLNMLKELKLNLKSSNILTLLKIKNEIKFDTVHKEEYFKEIYSFGNNSDGQLGLGNTTDQSIPQLISLKNEKIKNVSCGERHTIFVC